MDFLAHSEDQVFLEGVVLLALKAPVVMLEKSSTAYLEEMVSRATEDLLERILFLECKVKMASLVHLALVYLAPLESEDLQGLKVRKDHQPNTLKAKC